MTAFRGKNFRSGDLVEQLGILLLQNVSSVSPIPRTEDVGIDVVSTLVRDFDGYKYIAEDSFFIQIKSTSVKKIKFEKEEVKWLADLELPYFIASVDKKTSKIYLYCTHYLSDVLATNPNREKITLEVAASKNYDCTDSAKSIKVPTGPYIISWTLETIEKDKDFIKKFYSLLKAHISISKKAIETRRIGIVDLIKWDNELEPKVFGTKINGKDQGKEFDNIAKPYLDGLLTKLSFGNDIHITRSLYRLLEKILLKEGHLIIEDGEKKLIPYKYDLKKIK